MRTVRSRAGRSATYARTTPPSTPSTRAAGSSASTRNVQPPGAHVMNRALPQEVLDQIGLEHQHFAAAPQAFFEAWKRGVHIAGAEWLGDGTREGLQRATTKWDLRPKL